MTRMQHASLRHIVLTVDGVQRVSVAACLVGSRPARVVKKVPQLVKKVPQRNPRSGELHSDTHCALQLRHVNLEHHPPALFDLRIGRRARFLLRFCAEALRNSKRACATMAELEKADFEALQRTRQADPRRLMISEPPWGVGGRLGALSAPRHPLWDGAFVSHGAIWREMALRRAALASALRVAEARAALEATLGVVEAGRAEFGGRRRRARRSARGPKWRSRKPPKKNHVNQ